MHSRVNSLAALIFNLLSFLLFLFLYFFMAYERYSSLFLSILYSHAYFESHSFHCQCIITNTVFRLFFVQFFCSLITLGVAFLFPSFFYLLFFFSYPSSSSSPLIFLLMNLMNSARICFAIVVWLSVSHMYRCIN